MRADGKRPASGRRVAERSRENTPEKPAERPPWRDPGRRERIADAAEQVIAERGIAGLTHRAVAEVAEVPLGSTTYHFKNLDDLLHMALERAVARFAVITEEWAAAHASTPRAELPALLANSVLQYCYGPARAAALVQYELYLAALRSDRLRPLAARFTDLVIDELTVVSDAETAMPLMLMMEGMILRCILTDTPPPQQDLEQHLRRILD